jgi:hypothetical protein
LAAGLDDDSPLSPGIPPSDISGHVTLSSTMVRIIKKFLSQNLTKLQSNSQFSSFPAYMPVQGMDY